MGSALWQDERTNNAHKKKTDDLDEHVGGGVNRGESVPIPVGNVRRDGRQDSGNSDETDPAGKTYNAGLRQKEHDQNGFDQFGSKFDAQPFAKRERTTG